MDKLLPVPEVLKKYWFYANDQVKKETEYEATVTRIYTREEAEKKNIYKYDDDLQEVVPNPVLYYWMEEAIEMFWILAEETDYIVELWVPDLCVQYIYLARTVDGGWHSFETWSTKQWGFLDLFGECYNELHKNDNKRSDEDLPGEPEYF